MKLLQWIWKHIVYYNFWKHILHLILYRSIAWLNLLGFWLLIKLSAHLFFPLVSNCEEKQVLGVLLLCCEQGKKFSDFGIRWSSNSFILIGQLALYTWGLNFVPIKLLEIYS